MHSIKLDKTLHNKVKSDIIQLTIGNGTVGILKASYPDIPCAKSSFYEIVPYTFDCIY
jgi:hypothetical protein